MRRRSFYSSYKGRRSSRDKKLILFSTLLLIIVCTGAAFILLTDFIVFTSDGFRFTFQNEEEADIKQDENDDEDLNIVINGKPQDESDSSDPIISSLPPVAGVIDDISNILSATYAKGLASAALERGCTTLCFSIKDESGVLQIPITSAYSSQGGQSSDADAIKQSLEIFDQYDNLYLAAYITCFADDRATEAFPQNAVTTQSGSVWIDSSGHAYIDPYSDMAREYLCDIIDSCARAGFDMVILDGLAFPTSGSLSQAIYSSEDIPENRQAVIAKILSEIKATADSHSIAVSVVLDDPLSDGTVSGQNIEKLAPYCHTLFCRGSVGDMSFSSISQALAQSSCLPGCISGGAFDTQEGDISFIGEYLKP